jgi:hypothetical protein
MICYFFLSLTPYDEKDALTILETLLTACSLDFVGLVAGSALFHWAGVRTGL